MLVEEAAGTSHQVTKEAASTRITSDRGGSRHHGNTMEFHNQETQKVDDYMLILRAFFQRIYIQNTGILTTYRNIIIKIT